MSIRVLPPQLASQIAAGEVVERPASVVKELVENAIDAGARTINIDVRYGGRQLIQVADDGQGIPGSELEIAFQRHATSKISQISDLNSIRTLGFRGEALAAIAAVSQVTIISRIAEEAAGTRLTLEAGQVAERESVGAPQGTVVAVENLFYNVPARLKFLKSVVTEKRHIDEFVTRYALVYPEIRFRLAHDNRITFQTGGNGNLIDVLVAVYGPETARELLEIHESQPESDDEPTSESRPSIVVSGYVSPPSLHFANRNQIVLFLNGRWIRDSGLAYAVVQAYHTLLPTGRYPLGVIFLSCPPDRVDVNVHPAKTEVRFRQRDTVFGAVQRAVRQTLVQDAPIRGLGAWAAASRFDQRFAGWEGSLQRGISARGSEAPQAHLGLEWSGPIDPAEAADRAMSAAELGGQRLPVMRVVGQVGAAYIIAEGPDGIFLIDQHAAHERILYERFMAEREQKAIASQGLVTGIVVHLSPPQATLLEDQLGNLARLGFEIEPFGPSTFRVQSIPALLNRLDPAQALLSVVEELEEGEKPLQSKIEDKIILRVCKTAAVKAGQTLSMAEMEAIIRQLETCHSPHTCPHGRPTLIHLSVAQLAKEFGRI